jgi:hypothetical protein
MSRMEGIKPEGLGDPQKKSGGRRISTHVTRFFRDSSKEKGLKEYSSGLAHVPTFDFSPPRAGLLSAGFNEVLEALEIPFDAH